MKLAVSNIAWANHNDPEILKFLAQNNVQGIEVAPTKIWQNWVGASQQNAQIYSAELLANYGFAIPAMQAILFGKDDLQLFKPETHTVFLEHFKLLADIAAGFGAKVMVFGAPKNRKRGQISNQKAQNIAAEFFYKAAEICNERNCIIGLEPNPIEYGCDFMTNVADVREMVDLVNHKGLQLHLDSAAIHMCGGGIVEIINNAGEFVHYHISQPMLSPICGDNVDHANAIRALKQLNYNNWVSVEMREPENIDVLYKSINYIVATYALD